jgi:hypothetical protein
VKWAALALKGRRVSSRHRRNLWLRPAASGYGAADDRADAQHDGTADAPSSRSNAGRRSAEHRARDVPATAATATATQQQPPQAPYQTRQPAPQPQRSPMQPGQPKQQQRSLFASIRAATLLLKLGVKVIPDPSLGAQIATNPAFAGIRAVDITETPTPRGRSTEGDVLAEVRAILGENPEAQSLVDQLETTLSNPEATSEERQRAITTAAGVENDKEGLRSVVTDLTGEEPPANATVDELNRAIMGVSIGGAIGGPGSVAERISNAILQGLEVQRETAVGRERFGQELAVARAKAKPDEVKGFLETPRGEAAVEMLATS